MCIAVQITRYESSIPSCGRQLLRHYKIDLAFVAMNRGWIVCDKIEVAVFVEIHE